MVLLVVDTQKSITNPVLYNFDAFENANSTFDNAFMTGGQSYKYYNEFMWRGRYAECISVEETIERMKR